MSATFQWFGRIAAGLSIFWLLHAWLQFGLSAAFTQLRSYYEVFVYPIAEVFRAPIVWAVTQLGLELPSWWRDALLIYVLVGASLFRSLRHEPVEFRAWRAPRILVEKVAKVTQLDPGTSAILTILWPLFPAYLIIAPALGIRILRRRNRASKLDDAPMFDDAPMMDMFMARMQRFKQIALQRWGYEVSMTFLGASLFLIANAGVPAS